MSPKPLTLIFSSAGRRVELMRCFRSSAESLGIPLHVIACDTDPTMSSACHLADDAFKVPRCNHPEFIPAMAEIAGIKGAGLIVPTIDPELYPYALTAGEFAKIGTRVHVSDVTVVQVARDKLTTMRVLAEAGVAVPRTVDLEEARRTTCDWNGPLFVKPRSGSASRNLSIVNTAADLPDEASEPMIVQEYLDGPEFTVNIFIDYAGILKCVVAHRRLRTRAGEVEKGRTERYPALAEIAQNVAQALPGARGALCFQVIEDKFTGPRVIEINARFGGGYPLAHHAGAHFSRWLLEEVSGLPTTAHDNWREDVLMMRYDAAVFEG